MNVEQITEIMRTQGVDAALAAREKLYEEVMLAKNAADAACTAYNADLCQRENRVAERVTGLEQQHQVVLKQIEAKKGSLVSATMSGDDTAFMGIQDEIAELKARGAAIKTQIEILATSAVPGSAELYQAVAERNGAWEKLEDEIMAIDDAMYSFAAEQINEWDKIRRIYHYKPDLSRDPHAHRDPYRKETVLDRVEQVFNHYRQGTNGQ